jgi:hypothetical protein
MAFLPLIPQSTDQLSISQGNILNNFTILGAIAGNANPSSASININSGFNWVYLPVNGATPPAGAAFPAGDIGLYSALNAGTGRNELYINHSVAGPTVVQTPATAAVKGGTNAGNGWTYLPSGMIMAWGRSNIAAGGTVTLTYAAELTNFPGFSSVNNIPLVTRINNAANTANFVVVSAYNQTTFTVRSSAGGNAVQFSWFVISN